MAKSHPQRPFSTRLRWLLAVFLLCFVPLGAVAEELSASATLDSNVALPREPVTLEITVEGTQSVPPPKIAVDGLDIRYIGPQRLTQMNNFEVSHSITHRYQVSARREGEFLIPAQTIKVGHTELATRPLKLTVNRTGTLPGAEGEGEGRAEAASEVFMEWVVPRETLYLGEVVPVELRLFMRDDVPFRLNEMPKVKTDGLVLREFPREPQQGRVERNGHRYRVVVFKSTLSAVKAGELKLEATVMPVLKLVQPRRPSARQRMGQGFPDIFNDPFFNMQPRQSALQPVDVTAPDVTLTVKPLPTEGRPKDFSGAVGRFSLSTKASPTQGSAGDPISVTSTVSGSGNFQRMEAPKIAAGKEWQVYPPSARFEADDDVEISGEKIFQQAIIPSGPATELPGVSFSYFDPVTEKYVTLTGDRIPLEITGTAPKPTPTPSAAIAAATPSSTPEATPAAEPGDILFIRTDGPGRIASFEAVWKSRAFIAAQALPLAALLVVGLVCWKRRRDGDTVARRRAALRDERQAALRALKDESLPAARFYEAAVTALRNTVALAKGGPLPGSAAEVCAGRSLSGEEEQAIVAAFEGWDAIRYGGVKDAPVSPARRAAILKALEQLEK